MNLLLTALCFLAGVCLTLAPAALYTPQWLLALLLALPLSWAVRARIGPQHPVTRLAVLLCIMLAAASWASFRASLYLQARLPDTVAGQDIVVSGRVVDIPQSEDGVQRFEFELDDFDIEHVLAPLPHAPQKLRLSWYYAPAVNAGEHWQLRLRLKPPHGFFNPGGFDYEAWLYLHGIHATGYVRTSDTNRRLAVAPPWSLDRLRQRVFERIGSHLPDNPLHGVIAALAVGERAAIGPDQWRQLIATGTNHLVAISGLHIGLASAFGYLLVRRLLCRIMPARWLLAMPAQHMAILGGLLFATVYALLAGLTVPTQRALLMLAAFSLAYLLRRNHWRFDALGLALLVILAWQPVSVLAPGFWFSFLAVGVILYVMRGGEGARSRWWLRWGGIQLAIALALMPLSLFMFQQSSLVAPLANLVMVPYVSLLVVPLVLLAMLLMPFWGWGGDSLLWLAAGLMQLAWPLLDTLAELDVARWVRPQPELWVVLLAMLGIGWLLAPRQRIERHRIRALGALLLLPLLLLRPDAPDAGSFELHMLDVGQGLALVVRTRNHVMVYDTGARLGERLDAGDAVVVPFLRQLGVTRLDTLVVSHGDADHIGGADSVLRAFPAARVIGQDIDTLPAVSKSACRRDQHWHWDGVDFDMLGPVESEPDSGRRNNHSCVLRVSNAAGVALLTGDIERDVEAALLAEQAAMLPATVMLVPHHGSRTSSTAAFIAAVGPRYALLPAGYRNRYRLPADDVVARYHDAGSQLLISGLEGCVSLVFSPRHGVRLDRRERHDRHHYWNHLSPGMDE